MNIESRVTKLKRTLTDLNNFPEFVAVSVEVKGEAKESVVGKYESKESKAKYETVY